jgi:hypothetical protein
MMPPAVNIGVFESLLYEIHARFALIRAANALPLPVSDSPRDSEMIENR